MSDFKTILTDIRTLHLDSLFRHELESGIFLLSYSY